MSCTLATGQAAETPAIHDFSGGFQQLAALGLPALDSQAKWCSHPEAGNHYEFRELTSSLKGNGWLLPSTDGKNRLVSIGGVEIIKAGESGKKTKAAVPQNLTKDVEALISGLGKIAAKQENDDSSSSRYQDSKFGRVFLLAAQLHQTGHKDLANRLAMAVFSVFPTHEAAVDAAISTLAEHFYQQATQAFFESGDWAAYQKSLDALVKRFPRGWANKDAILMMLPQLEKQAAGTKAPAPSLPNIPIDPRALEILGELTEKPPADPKQADPSETDATNTIRNRRRMMVEGMEYGGNESTPPPLWVLQKESKTMDSEEKKSPLARLAELKMAALPALAALATDPFFTHFPNSQSYSGYYSSDETREEQILRAYSALNRPRTRGEIAKRWLAATLPDPEDELDDADAETLRDLALDFWKQHKDASAIDLAAVFLTEGSRSQASEAATFLAASTDPQAHQIFEKHLLASEQAIGYFRDVQTYLKARKASGKSFLAAYAKLVRSQTAGGQDENEISWQIKEAGGAAKILKQLESFVGGASPSVLAIKIARGKPEDAKSAIDSLHEMLKDAPLKKQHFTYLEGANAATDAEVRARFLVAISLISWEENETPEDKKSPPEERKVIDAEAAIWRKLLEDKRETPKRMIHYSVGATIAELAAYCFEESVSSEKCMLTREAAPVLGKTESELLLEQANARLAGKPIPPLPDASQVSPDRLKAIIAEAGKKAPIEIHPYLQTLSPDERAAWLAWVKEPGEIDMPKSVESLKMIVTEKTGKYRGSHPNAKDAVDMNVGFVVSPATIKTYVETLAKNLDKHSRIYLSLVPAAFGPGLDIWAIQLPIPKKKNEAIDSDTETLEDEINEPNALGYLRESIRTLKDQETAEGVIIVKVSGTQEPFVWLVEKEKAKFIDAKSQASIDSAFQNPEVNGYIIIRIEILSKSDAEKITALTEE